MSWYLLYLKNAIINGGDYMIYRVYDNLNKIIIADFANLKTATTFLKRNNTNYCYVIQVIG